nr:MAG TPA: hypothetical protein [Caudoviricetes sp.]
MSIFNLSHETIKFLFICFYCIDSNVTNIFSMQNFIALIFKLCHYSLS